MAATKTYTAELLALYLLVDALRGGVGAAARGIPSAAAATLAEPAPDAGRDEHADRLILTARGFAYATASEAALKLMETSYLAALAFSGADLLHGPLAILDRGSPIIAVAGEGPGGDAMAPVLDRLEQMRADVMIMGGGPPGVLEELAPILPLQRLALELALLRGLDPDRPRRGLRKVTATW